MLAKLTRRIPHHHDLTQIPSQTDSFRIFYAVTADPVPNLYPKITNVCIRYMNTGIVTMLIMVVTVMTVQANS